MLQKMTNTNYDVIIMDAFYHSELLTRAEVEGLKTKANGGKRLVIACILLRSHIFLLLFSSFLLLATNSFTMTFSLTCEIDVNIGAAENFRHYWQKDWKLHNPKFLKKPYEGYHEEMWVKYWTPEWRAIILHGPRYACFPLLSLALWRSLRG